MKEDIKNRWVEALRSGKYKQGQNVLHQSYEGQNDSFCCLGVLCDLAAKDGAVHKSKSSTYDPKLSTYRYDTSASGLSSDMRTWSGVASSEGRINVTYEDNPLDIPFDDVRGYTFLSVLNDRQNFTFEEIANVIEHYWKEL